MYIPVRRPLKAKLLLNTFPKFHFLLFLSQNENRLKQSEYLTRFEVPNKDLIGTETDRVKRTKTKWIIQHIIKIHTILKHSFRI